jgi:neutral ceramidase
MHLQLIRLGSLIIIAHPGEMTTMAGRRMRKTILDILGGDGVKHAVVATYAGAYSSYTTTREEYAMQHYEGASTLYGPWTLAAYQQENAKLATAMKNNVDVGPGPQPPDLSKKQGNLQTGVWFDDKPLDREFGDVIEQPKRSYNKGEKVKVSFYGAHPNNDLRTEDTFLKIERFVAGKWNEVYADKDFCTCFKWKRDGIANSIVTIEWQIPPNQDSGVYRISYYGNWKSAWTGKIKEFSGVSREFTVT